MLVSFSMRMSVLGWRFFLNYLLFQNISTSHRDTDGLVCMILVADCLFECKRSCKECGFSGTESASLLARAALLERFQVGFRFISAGDQRF